VVSVSNGEMRIAAILETTADFHMIRVTVGQRAQVTGDPSKQGTKVPMLPTEEERAKEVVVEEKAVEAAKEDEEAKEAKAVKAVREATVAKEVRGVKVAHLATCVGIGPRGVVGEVLEIVDFHTTRKQKGGQNLVETSREETVDGGQTVGSPTMRATQRVDKDQHQQPGVREPIVLKGNHLM
jgi:hypothetical protein